jgi:hypothetical protein
MIGSRKPSIFGHSGMILEANREEWNNRNRYIRILRFNLFGLAVSPYCTVLVLYCSFSSRRPHRHGREMKHDVSIGLMMRTDIGIKHTYE